MTSAAPEPIIRARNLSREFRSGGVVATALAGVTLEVRRGEFVAVMGPSGCGKSTLLNILGLLDAPTGGEYFFMGRATAGLGERQRATLRRGAVGFVFQNFNLIDDLSVADNVGLPLTYLGWRRPRRERAVARALERLRMGHCRDAFPSDLSGGQQQRVAIARAAVTSPSLILADEPTGNLDSDNGAEVMSFLTDLNEAGTTVIIVTHSRRDAAYAGREVQLLDGKVIHQSALRGGRPDII